MTWKAPKSDGGSLITGYVIERREGSRTTWTKVGETSSETRKYKATRLTEGTEYAFRVAAENSIGVGEFATIDKPVTADVPFGQSLSSFCSSIKTSFLMAANYMHLLQTFFWSQVQNLLLKCVLNAIFGAKLYKHYYGAFASAPLLK